MVIAKEELEIPLHIRTEDRYNYDSAEAYAFRLQGIMPIDLSKRSIMMCVTDVRQETVEKLNESSKGPQNRCRKLIKPKNPREILVSSDFIAFVKASAAMKRAGEELCHQSTFECWDNEEQKNNAHIRIVRAYKLGFLSLEEAQVFIGGRTLAEFVMRVAEITICNHDKLGGTKMSLGNDSGTYSSFTQAVQKIYMEGGISRKIILAFFGYHNTIGERILQLEVPVKEEQKKLAPIEHNAINVQDLLERGRKSIESVDSLLIHAAKLAQALQLKPQAFNEVTVTPWKNEQEQDMVQAQITIAFLNGNLNLAETQPFLAHGKSFLDFVKAVVCVRGKNKITGEHTFFRRGIVNAESEAIRFQLLEAYMSCSITTEDAMLFIGNPSEEAWWSYMATVKDRAIKAGVVLPDVGKGRKRNPRDYSEKQITASQRWLKGDNEITEEEMIAIMRVRTRSGLRKAILRLIGKHPKHFKDIPHQRKKPKELIPAEHVSAVIGFLRAKIDANELAQKLGVKNRRSIYIAIPRIIGSNPKQFRRMKNNPEKHSIVRLQVLQTAMKKLTA